MADLEKIVDEISKLTALELSDLVKKIEEKFGVSAAPTFAVGAPTQVGGGEIEEEKSTFNVELKSTGAQKIAVIKIIRFFLMNPGGAFALNHVAKSTKISKETARRELNLLCDINFIKCSKKGKEKVYQLNNLFQYKRALKHLVVESAPISRDLLLKRFRGLGRGLKFVALSGIFSGSSEGGLDILIVGDNIRKSRLDKILGKTESELGREIKYVLFDTKEFKYRHSMYDKFIMDVLDGEHDVLIDNLKAGA